MDRLPQISVKATKAKASDSFVHVVSTYNTRKLNATVQGAGKFTDTITAVYGMYTENLIV